MTEVAMLHSRLHADTKSVNSKILSAQGRYQGVRMAAFPGMNCSRASQQNQTCLYTVRSTQASRKGHSHCSSLVHLVQREINLNFTAETVARVFVALSPNAILPAFKYPGLESISSCVPYIATQKRERLIYH